MTRKIFLPLLLMLMALAARPASLTQNSQPATTAPVSIPFELVTRHIVLKVKVNNSRPLSFVLDTGDQVGVIDIELAKELGLTLEGEIRVGGAGSGTLPGARVAGATWTLPGLDGFSQPVRMAIPLRRMAARFGHDFDGIIGAEFIKQFVVEVDYAARVVRLHNRDQFTYNGKGESVPIQLDGQGHPILEGEVRPLGGEPIHGKFVLDIGSSGPLALTSPFVNQNQLLEGTSKTIRAIGLGGAGGKSNGRVGRTAELQIGQYKISNPLTVFSQDTGGAFASSALAGNIGQQIASRFKIFLDYSHGRIIFEPVASFTEPFDRAHSGLALSSEGKDYTTFRITEVLEDSPASEAGLQNDDLIIKVNDQPAEKLTITKLQEMFERPATFKLTILRGERTLQVSLTTRKMV